MRKAPAATFDVEQIAELLNTKLRYLVQGGSRKGEPTGPRVTVSGVWPCAIAKTRRRRCSQEALLVRAEGALPCPPECRTPLGALSENAPRYGSATFLFYSHPREWSSLGEKRQDVITHAARAWCACGRVCAFSHAWVPLSGYVCGLGGVGDFLSPAA